MKNIRETLGNALMIGGLLTTAGTAIDAVRTHNSSAETQRVQAITDELRNEFDVHEVCGPNAAPSSFVCRNEGDRLSEFNAELKKQLKTVEPDKNARRRLAEDIGGMIAGEVIVIAAASRKEK